MRGWNGTNPRYSWWISASLSSSVVQSLGNAIEPWGYVILFVLALLEASAFVGLVVPGEAALLLAGFLAREGRVSLWWCVVAATLGAILGDSLGYEIGRRFGPRLRSSWFGRKVGDERWERAHDLVHRLGGSAIFVARWIGVLRALVPAIAGDARMPYGRFLFWNALSALLSVPALVIGGYLAGSSYHVLEQRMGQVGWVLFAVVVIGVSAVHAFRHRHRDHAHAR